MRVLLHSGDVGADGSFDEFRKVVLANPLKGVVDSLGWGLAQSDGSTSHDLLPAINPTFSWIRLAQRVPVRVYLRDVPERGKLRVGTTASVLVKTGTAGALDESKAVASPSPLR